MACNVLTDSDRPRLDPRTRAGEVKKVSELSRVNARRDPVHSSKDDLLWLTTFNPCCPSQKARTRTRSNPVLLCPLPLSVASLACAPVHVTEHTVPVRPAIDILALSPGGSAMLCCLASRAQRVTECIRVASPAHRLILISGHLPILETAPEGSRRNLALIGVSLGDKDHNSDSDKRLPSTWTTSASCAVAPSTGQRKTYSRRLSRAGPGPAAAGVGVTRGGPQTVHPLRMAPVNPPACTGQQAVMVSTRLQKVLLLRRQDDRQSTPTPCGYERTIRPDA